MVPPNSVVVAAAAAAAVAGSSREVSRRRRRIALVVVGMTVRETKPMGIFETVDAVVETESYPAEMVVVGLVGVPEIEEVVVGEGKREGSLTTGTAEPGET